ncbi:cingulin-like isoform X1 [Chrysemys picta bellii]|uniref:cingulin-like isoform X1 n=1 Tax=Chrysemys picta bellii TaxID=8478 RepID=UPI0032B1EF8B
MEDQSDTCRLCSSPLQGSQRRWLFHRAPQRPDLRVLLAHVCREAPCRGDGRSEFLCGKCAQALGRVFRFDTVIARVQVLSLERLRRLLEEKERLVRCLRHLHARRSPTASLPPSPAGAPQLPDVSYQRLLQEDMVLAGFECWVETGAAGSPCQNRWCPGCHGLRVPDADYEWVCGTPRQLRAGSPALPLCRDKSQSMPLVLRAGVGGTRGHSGSLLSLRSCSLLSLDSLAGHEPLGEALRALGGIGRRALRVPRGSRIPVLAGRAAPSAPPTEMEEEEEQEEEEEEIEDEFVPLGMKALAGRRLRRRELPGAVEGLAGRLAAAEGELRRLRAKTGGWAPEDAGVPSAPGAGPGRERVLGVLAQCLHSKEATLQDCLAALESLAPPGSLVPHLCGRLKERDEALERTLADHFLELERERSRLQGALRDKDRDLGRLAAALRTGEQTLHALRETLEQKELERTQLASLCAMAQDAWRRQDQTRALALKEMQELVAALQAALASSTKDLELFPLGPVLIRTSVATVCPHLSSLCPWAGAVYPTVALSPQVLAESPAAPAPALLQRLQEQEGLLAEALAERARLAAEMEARLQGALAAAEQQLQDQMHGCTQALAKRAREAGALRGRLARQEGALAEGADALVRCRAELARLRGLLEERDDALAKAAREAEEKDRRLQASWLQGGAGGMTQTL